MTTERTGTTRHTKCLLTLSLLLLAASGAAQTARLDRPTIRVNGSPVLVSRPAAFMGAEWFVPLAAISDALGVQVRLATGGQQILIRRQDGAEVAYDGRTGEIRRGFVLIGRIPDFRQIVLDAGLQNVMFPVSGIAALFDVTVREDQERNSLEFQSIEAGTTSGAGSGPGFRLATLEYDYGLTTNGRQYGQFVNTGGEGLAGRYRLSGHLLLSRIPGRGFLGFTQGVLRVEFSPGRKLVLGDQATHSGIDALGSSVRGVGYETSWRNFMARYYAGRAVGTSFLTLGSVGFASYDTTVAGASLQRRAGTNELAFAANAFRGDQRRGITAGFAYSGQYLKNQFKAQALGGFFSGLSSRTIPGIAVEESNALDVPGRGRALQPGDDLTGTVLMDEYGQTIVLAPQTERARVRGGALGFSLTDTFTPFRQLSVTGQWERYGRDFLTVRDDARFNATSNRALAIQFRPVSYLSLNASAADRSYLLGSASDRSRNYSYGATAFIPAGVPVQLAFFRSLQADGASGLGRFSLTQYSLSVPSLRRHSAYAYYTRIEFAGQELHSINASAVGEYGRLGRFEVHNQLQTGISNRVGVTWEMPAGRRQSFVRLGIDRLSTRQQRSALLPVASVRVPLPRGQTLHLSYTADRNSHILQIGLGGPVLRHREIVRNNIGVASILAQVPVAGRVYLDSDLNGRYDHRADRGIADVRIWLDNGQSAVTGADGAFRFEHIPAGAHVLRAELAGVPAGLVFADGEQRTFAAVAYRTNVQEFRVIPTGLITGTVTYVNYVSDPDKPVEQPLPDARIVASDAFDSFSEINGNFLIGDLPPGTYHVRLDPSTIPAGYIPQPLAVTVNVMPGEKASANFRLVRPVKPLIEKLLPAQSVRVN